MTDIVQKIKCKLTATFDSALKSFYYVMVITVNLIALSIGNHNQLYWQNLFQVQYMKFLIIVVS